MGRKPRVYFAGALYYVTSPGDQRQSNFKEKPDRCLGKLAEELASKLELRGVVERRSDSLRKGRRPKNRL